MCLFYFIYIADIKVKSVITLNIEIRKLYSDSFLAYDFLHRICWIRLKVQIINQESHPQQCRLHSNIYKIKKIAKIANLEWCQDNFILDQKFSLAAWTYTCQYLEESQYWICLLWSKLPSGPHSISYWCCQPAGPSWDPLSWRWCPCWHSSDNRLWSSYTGRLDPPQRTHPPRCCSWWCRLEWRHSEIVQHDLPTLQEDIQPSVSEYAVDYIVGFRWSHSPVSYREIIDSCHIAMDGQEQLQLSPRNDLIFRYSMFFGSNLSISKFHFKTPERFTTLSEAARGIFFCQKYLMTKSVSDLKLIFSLISTCTGLNVFCQL